MPETLKVVMRRDARCGEVELKKGDLLATVTLEHGELNYLVDAVRNKLAGEAPDEPAAPSKPEPKTEPSPAAPSKPEPKTEGTQRQKASDRAKQDPPSGGKATTEAAKTEN